MQRPAPHQPPGALRTRAGSPEDTREAGPPWNPRAGRVSSSPVLRCAPSGHCAAASSALVPGRARRVALALSISISVLALAGGARRASAQPERAAAARESATEGGAIQTGYELALSGPRALRAGREARFRGVAYRVLGIAELSPFAARVRARLRTDAAEGAWIEQRADAEGRFDLALPIPATALGEEMPRVEVEIGAAAAAGAGARDVPAPRTFEIPVALEPAWRLLLRTDRRLYEPGEPVHVWLLARDAASLVPAAARPVRIELRRGSGGARVEQRETSAAGVAHVELALGEDEREGEWEVRALVDGASATASFRVGRRTWERMFATLELEPDEVAPGAPVTVRAHVTTPDAAPIRDATVEVRVGDEPPVRGTTDAIGDAAIVVRAPAYLAAETGLAQVRAHVAHPAHGSIDVGRTMHVAVPLALSIEAIPAHGALVPEVDDRLFVQLEDVLGHPPPQGTEVEVVGPAIPGGRAIARTDENGLAEVAVRLPRGASSGGGASSGDEESASSTVRVHVRGGPLARTARIAVPVRRAPEVVPVLARPRIAPGDAIEVRLERAPAAARRAVIVELLDARREEPLAIARVAPGASRAELRAPRDRLGVLSVRARAVHEDESLEGTGASEALLVVPASPAFVSLDPVRPRWRVGETAALDLRTGAAASGAPRAWAAVLVRDLAAHGGELDFREEYLDRAFEHAVLEAPATEPGARLVRASLAAWAALDPVPARAAPLLDALGLPAEPSAVSAEGTPGRGTLRDPWPLSRELARRGVGAAMTALEAALESALESGTLDEITVVSGPSRARRFREDLLDGAGAELETLGGAPITPSMLAALDRGFDYDAVARRVARARLVRLLAAVASYVDPGDEASVAARTAAREPWERWLTRMIERGVIAPEALDDPWGGRFALHRTRAPAVVLAVQATDVELASPGPDGRIGTADDVRDPFARAVAEGTPYAVASGEDALMRRLAILSPARRTLAAIREAYRRISAEMTEDEIGDAVHADVSEGTIGLGNLGTIGHGAGGGGYGSGYGSGAGSFHGRSAAVPAVRAGGANLARLVRERFPPTIVFRPELAVDPSGTTRLEVPLADAVTTYRVEAVVWREDGWIWSARAEISSDRDVVIDAPIPEVATVGDRLEVPLRVQNRTESARTIEVRMIGEPALGVASSAPVVVTVAPGDAAVVPVEIAPGARGLGSVRVEARDAAAGTPLDAVRRPIRVVEPARRASARAEALVVGRGALTLAIEEGADPRDAQVRIAVGAALFDAPSAVLWAAWSGDPVEDADDPVRIFRAQREGGAALGFAIGATYVRAGASDERLRVTTERLAHALDRVTGSDAAAVGERAWALLGLAPAARAPERRPAIAEVTAQLAERLVREVAEGALALEDAPDVIALAAAALGSSGGEGARPRVAELVRRLERAVVVVGEDEWIATPERPLRATILLSMAELSLGHRERAFRLLATVARWSARGRALGAEEAGLARAAARWIGGGAEAPSVVRLTIDGETQEVPLVGGRGEVSAPGLAASGAHAIEVACDEGAGAVPLHVDASARFGVPWSEAPPRPGPFALRVEGEAHGRDEIAGLALIVANRSPRWITAPVVEIELPTGAELPWTEEREMRRVVRGTALGENVLTIELRPLAPGQEVRVPLPLRWTIAGGLRGLGIAAYARDRSDAITVLAPTEVRVAGGGE